MGSLDICHPRDISPFVMVAYRTNGAKWGETGAKEGAAGTKWGERGMGCLKSEDGWSDGESWDGQCDFSIDTGS